MASIAPDRDGRAALNVAITTIISIRSTPMTMRQLCRRVLKIERHLSPSLPCSVCGGAGHTVCRWTDLPPELGGDGVKDRGSPCPACGRANIINIVMTDQITPQLEAAGRV